MKKIISMLLVLALMITVLTVGMATTTAAETATITIYGIDGTTDVKEVNVGEEFTVYTTLDVSGSVSDGMVASVQGNQTYSTDVLQLQDSVSGSYGEFDDVVKVFPVTGDATISNAAQAGKIVYNASTPNIGNGFEFVENSLLIVTTYKVTAAGSGEVKNAIVNLAAADNDITKIVFQGTVQEGKSVAGKAYFTDPTPAIDHAVVRIHSLDGSVETKDFNIGDTFTVYTNLDASSVNDGVMGSINGVQRYTSSVLALADDVDNGEFTDLEKVFPIMKDSALANAKTAGVIKYSGSSTTGFTFDSATSQLIVTTYTVTANGYADVTNKLNVLAAADDDITRIVFNGDLQSGKSYDMPASFSADGPEPPTTLTVTIVNPDNTTAVKEFTVGQTFTVYTVLNAGTIASVDGTQTYPTSKLQLTDAVSNNEVTDSAAMFPILGDEVVASAKSGSIKFNASRGAVGGGYAFTTDESKLIVTNYKVLATGTATIKTTLKTLIKDDEDATKIVFNSTTQSGQSYSMVGSFTDPGNPVIPTEPQPTETQPEPTTPSDKAVVTIYGLDGTSRTKTFSIGDEFTVYTTMDASKLTGIHGIGSISASQTFTDTVLQSTDEVDELQAVVDTEAMFPIFGAAATAKIADGLNKYNASTPGINKGFVFADETALLAVTNYKVIAAGNAEIRNSLTTMAGDDSNLTKIVMKGVLQDGMEIGGIATFWPPSEPEPTEPPTEPAPETQPQTEPVDQKATVTIYGFDGTSKTETYSVGESFTVYTTFDASKAAANGMIGSINANQTFTSSILKSTDAVDSEGIVTDNAAMFPILGDNAMARITTGKVLYNASTASTTNAFAFPNDSSVLIVTNYQVTAAGNAEVRNALTTVGAADADLTRIVDKGVVADGKEIGGIASFTDPSTPSVRYLLGDVDNNDSVESDDVVYIQRKEARMKLNIDEAIMLRNGDVNGDGLVDISDATIIQRHLARMTVKYPVGQYIEA